MAKSIEKKTIERVNSIIDIVAKKYEVPASVVKTTTNFLDYIKIQHTARYCLYHFLNSKGEYFDSVFSESDKDVLSLSLLYIAEMTGGVKHSTTISSCKTVIKRMKEDKETSNIISDIFNTILKECDFGTRKIICEASNQHWNQSLEMMRDKKGNRYYRIKSPAGTIVFTQCQFDVLMKLRNEIYSKMKETDIYGKR